MNPAISVLLQLQGFSENPNAPPVLVKLFDEILDVKRPVLGSSGWASVNRASKTLPSDVKSFKQASESLETWMNTWLGPGNPGAAAAPGMSRTDEAARQAAEITKLMSVAVDDVFKAVKRVIAEVETYVDERPMMEMSGIAVEALYADVGPKEYIGAKTELHEALVEDEQKMHATLAEEERSLKETLPTKDRHRPQQGSAKVSGSAGGNSSTVQYRQVIYDALQLGERSPDDALDNDSDDDLTDAVEIPADELSSTTPAAATGGGRADRPGITSQRSRDTPVAPAADDPSATSSGSETTPGATPETSVRRASSAQDVLSPKPSPRLASRRLSAAQIHSAELDQEFLRRRSVLAERTRSLYHMCCVSEYYIVYLVATTTILALSDITGNTASRSKCVEVASEIASHYVRVCLTFFERVVSLQPALFKRNVCRKTLRGLSRAPVDEFARQLVYQTRLLDTLFGVLDIFVFPPRFQAHRSGLKCMAISNIDSNYILTAGYDRAARIHDLRTGECLAQYIGHTSVVCWAAFSSDDSFVVSASMDASVKIWDTQSASCRATLTGHTDSILSGDLAPSDRLIVTCGMDSTVRLWGVESGLCFNVFSGHSPGSWVKSVRFLHNSTGFISAGLDRKLILWSMQASAPSAGGDGAGDSQVIATSDEAALEPTLIENAHEDYILGLAVSTLRGPAAGASELKGRSNNVDGEYVVSTSKDKTARIWSLSPLSTRRTLKSQGSPSWCSCVAISDDGETIACGSFDNSVLLFGARTGKLLRQLSVHNEGILTVAFARAEPGTLLLGTANGHVQIIKL